MNRNSLSLILVALVALALVGCAQPPTELVEAARARVASIEEEGALYAADRYRDAQAAVGDMDAEVTAQAGRLAVTRSYDRTTELAGVVGTAADGVEGAIDAEKQRLRTQATQMVEDAERALTDTRETLAELPEEETASLLNEVTGGEASVAAAKEALGRDEVSVALREAEAAMQVASRVNASVLAMAEPETAPAVDELRAVRGGIDISRTVYLDGEPLAAGAYTLRLAPSGVSPLGGETPASTRWIEFVRDSDGVVAGRGLAAAIADADIEAVAKGWVRRNQASVDELLGGDYVRVWLNRGGVSYLVHAPTSMP